MHSSHKAIHAQEAKAEALAKIEQVATKLELMKLGKAAELVRTGDPETLSCYAFPEQYWRRILDRIEAEVPQSLEVHLVLDNASTHKTPAIRRWLLKRPRYHLHFMPTSASWINLVER